MKYTWKILIGIVSVLLVLFIISLFLPSEFRIERRVQFSVPASVVFDKVNDLQTWPAWSPFGMNDSSVVSSFSADSRGIGAWLKWSGPPRRDGRITIVSLAANKSIELAIEFGESEPDTGPVNSTMLFSETAAGGSALAWSFWGSVSGPLEKYLALFIDGQMGERFELSLADLKERVEPATP